MPDVQRFHHGAEIRLDTRRKRRRNRQGGRCLRCAQAQERRTRRRGTEDAECRRGVPALGMRKSFLNSSIALITAVGQLLTREFKPPPGVTNSGKPEPASS